MEDDPRGYFSNLLKRNNLVPHTCEVIYKPPGLLDLDTTIGKVFFLLNVVCKVTSSQWYGSPVGHDRCPEDLLIKYLRY